MGHQTLNGVCLLVTDDRTRGTLALPVPGKGRAHLKFLAGEIVKYIGACGFSTVILKSDGEPAMRMLQEIIQQARLKLGFKTTSEFSGPGDSQANGRDPDCARVGQDSHQFSEGWCRS